MPRATAIDTLSRTLFWGSPTAFRDRSSALVVSNIFKRASGARFQIHHLSGNRTWARSKEPIPSILGYRSPQSRCNAQRYILNGGSRWIATVGVGLVSNKQSRDSDPEATRSLLDGECEIKIIDFSDERLAHHKVTSTELPSFLKEQTKPDWAACRWIHVNGLKPNVVRCLGNHKGLHRLAIEDVLDRDAPTKVDWYDGHCFIVLTLQKLISLQHVDVKNLAGDGIAARTVRVSSPDSKDSSDHVRDERPVKWRTVSHRRFGMSVEHVSLFLTYDNTVITIFERSGEDIFAPIWTRLQSPQTVIRSCNDPSMLVQAVVDGVVDLSIPIGKAVGDAFGELELSVLSNPTIEQSKQLYVLRKGLTLLMDNIIAIGGLVRTLCDHRVAPQNPEEPNKVPAKYPAIRDVNSPKASSTVRISPMTQVYLQDVQDHVTTLSNSTHVAIRSTENLSSLIFNTITASQNESVRQLTLVSCFFLPLTFLTGYFGMNFDPMPVVNNNSDAYFWYIATPVMVTTMLLLVSRTTWRRSSAWLRKARRKDVSQAGGKP